MNVIELKAEIEANDLAFDGELSTEISIHGGDSGTKYYDRLLNKPQINGWELRSGNNTLTDIGVTQLVDNKMGNVEALLAII